MARGSGIFTRILQIILDTASAEKAKKDAQDALRKATDPKNAEGNLKALGAAFGNMVAAINRKISALRIAHSEQVRMTAAVKQGAEAVNALKVTLAGEAAARKLGVAATMQQRALAAAFAEETEQSRQRMEAYTASVAEATAAQQRLGAEMARDIEQQKAAQQKLGAVMARETEERIAAQEKAQQRLGFLMAKDIEEQIAAQQKLGAVMAREVEEKIAAQEKLGAVMAREVEEQIAAQRKLEAAQARDEEVVEDIRRQRDEQERMTAATMRGERAVNELKVALAGERAALRLGTTATAEHRAEVIRDAQATERARQAQDAHNRSLKQTSVVSRFFTSLTRSVSSYLTGLLAVTTAIFAARKLIEWADGWKMIAGRLKLVTDSSHELKMVQDEVFDIAQKTRTEFAATATLYQRVALNAEELGKSQEDLFSLTTVVSQAMQLAGATSVEARAGVIQLSQALASGVLRGDEFRSIMENLPGVAHALAKGLDVPVGKLREMAFAGELTANTVIDALLKVKTSVDEDFKDIPVTIGSAFTVLLNNIQKFVGQADETTGASAALAEALLDIAGAITAIGDAFLKTKSFFDIDTKIEDWFKKNVTDPMRESLGFGKEGDEMFFNRQTGRFEKRLSAGGDLGFDLEKAQLEAAQARANALTPTARLQELLARLTSDHTKALQKAKAAGEASKAELAELNALYDEGNKFLHAGNLSLQQRAELISALMDAGFKFAELMTQEELNKLEEKRVKMLIEARQLHIATQDEQNELMTRLARYNALLRDGNLELEERLRLMGLSRDITDQLLSELQPVRERSAAAALAGGQGGLSPVGGAPRVGFTSEGFLDEEAFLAGAVPPAGAMPIRAGPTPTPMAPDRDALDAFKEHWLSTHEDIQSVAENAAFGVANVWQDAFEAIAEEGNAAVNFMEALFKGMAGVAFGALAEIASTKIAENIAQAFEQFALAAGRTAVGDLAGAALHSASAKGHILAAAKWAVVGGAAAAIQGGVAGGGRGGQSGGLPSGARDPAGRLADQQGRNGQPIHIHFVGIADPKSPRFQELIGKTSREYAQRYGGKITTSTEGFPT